jgi:predicted nucleic acid-binding Zn ribbon protein
MERRSETEEIYRMKCHVCGSTMQAVITDLKDLPVVQCASCSEYLLDDPVMERVEEILAKVDAAAELEVVRFAA